MHPATVLHQVWAWVHVVYRRCLLKLLWTRWSHTEVFPLVYSVGNTVLDPRARPHGANMSYYPCLRAYIWGHALLSVLMCIITTLYGAMWLAGTAFCRKVIPLIWRSDNFPKSVVRKRYEWPLEKSLGRWKCSMALWVSAPDVAGTLGSPLCFGRIVVGAPDRVARSVDKVSLWRWPSSLSSDRGIWGGWFACPNRLPPSV